MTLREAGGTSVTPERRSVTSVSERALSRRAKRLVDSYERHTLLLLQQLYVVADVSIVLSTAEASWTVRV
jgi:hypothetical protein